VGTCPPKIPVHGPSIAYDRWREVCTGVSC